MLTKNMTIERENYNFEDVDINDIDFEFDETQTRIIHIEEEEKYKKNNSKYYIVNFFPKQWKIAGKKNNKKSKAKLVRVIANDFFSCSV